MAEESWKTLALALGNRLANHAFCDTHAAGQEDPENCPFCHDVVTYRRFLKKMGAENARGFRE